MSDNVENPMVNSSVGEARLGSLTLSWAARTEVGNSRIHNEDAFLALPGMFVVADGMGGHQAGDVAASIAVATMAEEFSGEPIALNRLSGMVRWVNAKVYRHAEEHGLAGMGCTLVGVVLGEVDGSEPVLAVFHVGDSRAYVLHHDGALDLVTHDHSLTQELVDLGQIDESKAASHPQRNVVTRAIGLESTVTPSVAVVPAADRQRVLLCSDGLSGQLSHQEIAARLQTAESAATAVDSLLGLVLSGPAPDNATAIVIDVVRNPASGVGR